MAYNSPLASKTRYGVVEVGANISVTTGVVDIPQNISTTANVTFGNISSTFDVFVGNTINVINDIVALGNIRGGQVFDNNNRVITSLTAGENITITGAAPSLTIAASASPNVTTKLISQADSPYTALASDYYIGVRANAAVTINLPVGGAGNTYVIKSEVTNTGNITIVPNGAQTIENTSSYAIIADTDGSVTLIFRGTNWNAV